MMAPAELACPSFEEISAAFSEGAAGPLSDHLDRCSRCASLWRELAAMKSAGAELPYRAPDRERAAELEAELVLRAKASTHRDQRRARRAQAVAVGALLAIAATSLIVLLTPKQPIEAPPIAKHEPVHAPQPVAAREEQAKDRRGTIRPKQGARFEHFVRHDGQRTDEVVRVAAGTVHVDVDPLAQKERFRVVTLDAEVEVRGTSFDVEVIDDRLRSVIVTSGLVEVRPKDGEPRLLAPGERWEAPAPEVEARPAPTRPKAAPIESPKVPEPHAPPEKLQEEPSASERIFAEAFDLLRAGDASGAADRLHEIDESSTDPIVEDAMYWRAIALARAKRGDEAESAMNRFLSKYPRSVRSGEVSVMLGWRLLDRGRTAEARARFEAAKDDASSRVRESAAAGLERLVHP
jgi:TolA-binding protein